MHKSESPELQFYNYTLEHKMFIRKYHRTQMTIDNIGEKKTHQ